MLVFQLREEAAKSGNVSLFKYLHSQNINLFYCNNWLLRNAAKEGHLEVIKYLKSIGAKYENNNELFRIAYENNQYDVIDYFLDKNSYNYFLLIREWFYKKLINY